MHYKKKDLHVVVCVRICVHILMAFHSTCCVYTAGEGLEFTGGPLIREESVEVDVSGDGRPDVAGNQAEEDKEKNSCTDQQTQESEVCLIRELLLTI